MLWNRYVIDIERRCWSGSRFKAMKWSNAYLLSCEEHESSVSQSIGHLYLTTSWWVNENSDDVDSRNTLKDEEIYASFVVTGKNCLVARDCVSGWLCFCFCFCLFFGGASFFQALFSLCLKKDTENEKIPPSKSSLLDKEDTQFLWVTDCSRKSVSFSRSWTLV